MRILATATKCRPLTISSPTVQGTAELLQQSQKKFIKSDESAFSIVPSRMSSRFSVSTIQTGDRDSVRSSSSLVYRQFSFENDLFTARVYKRNYRNPKYQGSRVQEPDRDVETVEPRKGNPQSSELADMSVLVQDLRDLEAVEPRKINLQSSELADISARLQDLISRKRNASKDQEYGDFVEACRNGDEDKVSKVIKRTSIYGGTVSSNLLSRKCDSVHFCPVHAVIHGGQAAVYGEHLGVLETLLDHDHLEHSGSSESLLFCTGRHVVVDGHEQRSFPPLHFAAYKGDLTMIQLLLRKGAPIHAKSDQGAQAIHSACIIGSIDVLTVLIAAGASVNCRDHKGRQPMHYLCETRRPEVIQFLAQNGAEIDGVSHSSQTTPLGIACENEIDANSRALLSLGALVTSSILDTAVRTGSPGLVETLLISVAKQEEGQSVMATYLNKNFTDLTAWSLYGVDNPQEKRMLQLLLKPTDLLLKDREGETVLHRLLDAQWKWKRDGRLFESMVFHQFLKILPYDKALEKDEIRLFVRRKNAALSANQKRDTADASVFLDQSSQSPKEKKTLSANRERGSTSASASSDLSSQDSQEKEARSENRESGSTGVPVSSGTILEQSPELKAFVALIRRMADHHKKH